MSVMQRVHFLWHLQDGTFQEINLHESTVALICLRADRISRVFYRNNNLACYSIQLQTRREEMHSGERKEKSLINSNQMKSLVFSNANIDDATWVSQILDT